MANISPDAGLEIADNAGAQLKVDPDGPTGVYELWTREVGFRGGRAGLLPAGNLCVDLDGQFWSARDRWAVPSAAVPQGRGSRW